MTSEIKNMNREINEESGEKANIERKRCEEADG